VRSGGNETELVDSHLGSRKGRTLPRRDTPFSPPSEFVALLLDLEELLLQFRSVGRASYRCRLEIEAEISAIRRDLARLGYEASGD